MDQEKTYKWIQDRLRDLHTGTLSEGDRMQMEELAKSDPFIRDAMDGYRSHANHDHSLLLKVLAQRIQNKTVSRRQKLLPLSRGWVLQAVAASLVLILATWAVIYYVEKEDEAAFVANKVETSPAIEKSTEVYLTDPDTMNDESTTSDYAMNESSGSRAKAKGKAEAMLRPANPHPGATAQQPAKDFDLTDATNKESDENTLNDPGISSPTPASMAVEESIEPEKNYTRSAETMAAGDVTGKNNSKRDEGYYANQMSPEMMAKRVSGLVTDHHGASLIGALVSIHNTNLVTTTDFYGKFELYLPAPVVTIDVINTGYKDTSITVSQGESELAIILDEDNDPPSAIARTETKSMQLKYQSTNLANTAAANFADYINKNSRYPVQSKYTSNNKEVSLEFRVNSEGRPVDIKYIKSSAAKKYMAEAIRLIKDGPDWVCEGGAYPCVMQYTIYFQ